MTFSRRTVTETRITSVCDICGAQDVSWFGPRIDLFEANHRCERAVT